MRGEEGKKSREELAEELARVRWRLAALQGPERAREPAGDAPREDEESYRLLVEGARDYAIFMLDSEGSVATWNVGAERIKGYRPDEILGRHFSALYPREDVERGRPGEVLRLAAAEGRYEEEGPRVRKDGSVFWAHVCLTALRDEEGRLRGFAKVTRDVTECKEAEEALRESEGRFRTLADNIPQLAWMADEDGWIFWYNKRWFDYTGTTLEEMQGWGWRKVHHPDHVERVVELLRRSWETGEPWEDAFPLRGGDGSYRWFLSRARPIRDGSGRIAHWFGTNTDVTEQREAQRALEESEERFRATFEQAAVGIAHVAPDGRWLRVNDRLCGIVGYGREELAGMTFEDITHPDDLEKDLGQVGRLLAGEIGTYSMEKRYLRKDGSAVWVDLTVSPVRDESGEPGYLIGVIEDITERRRAEEALRRQAELLDLSHEPIFAWELGGGVVYWNRGAQELYGFSKEEALGSDNHRLLGTVHPVSLERFEAELERDGGWAGELVHTARDGRRVVVESRHELVETSDGRRLVLETNRDVTERKEAEEELRRSGERIANVLESVADAFFAVDHEWRFTYVNRQAERVLRRTRGELLGRDVWEEFPEAVGSRFQQKYREAAETGRPVHLEEFYAPLGIWVEQSIHPSEGGLSVYFRDVTERKRAEEALREAREAERRRISRDLHDVVLQDLSGALQGLQLARLRAWRSGADPEELAGEIEALRRTAAGLRGAVYDLRREGERPFVRAVEDLVGSERRQDPEREVGLSVGEGFPEELPERSGGELLRVLGEALANARKHSGAGRVEVVLGTDGGRARLEVSDDGRGFEPDETSETPRGGVGLPAMRERVEALGGELEVRSRPGQGTRVRASVPL